MLTENLRIGTRGWLHGHWCGSYYPEDLPEDWRLGYYANEFRVVLVPVEYWQKSSGYAVEDWLDSVDEDFRFYLECPQLNDEEQRTQFETQCVLLGQQLGGVIVDEAIDIDSLQLKCPCYHYPVDTLNSGVVGFLEHDLDNLRAVRVWLEAFNKQSDVSPQVVFVTNRENPDISVQTLQQIRTLSEMMGL